MSTAGAAPVDLLPCKPEEAAEMLGIGRSNALRTHDHRRLDLQHVRGSPLKTETAGHPLLGTSVTPSYSGQEDARSRRALGLPYPIVRPR